MPNDDVKTLREAAFAISIKYADKHMSPETRLYYDATVISFNRMADMIEREEQQALEQIRSDLEEEYPTPDALQAAEDRGWNAAMKAAQTAVLDIVDGDYDGDLHFRLNQALIALRREPSK